MKRILRIETDQGDFIEFDLAYGYAPAYRDDKIIEVELLKLLTGFVGIGNVKVTVENT